VVGFRDLTPGNRFDLGEVLVDEAEMLDFASRYDPQWYHLDAERATRSSYGGVIASGFYTAALFMRLYATRVLADTDAHASPGVEELRWLEPVRAGDRLRGSLDVLSSAMSTARPGLATVTLQGELTRAGRPVLRIRFRGWFGPG
jgi:acyl dehydratase